MSLVFLSCRFIQEATGKHFSFACFARNHLARNFYAMARIVRTTEKNRKSFLLKAGLSIFLFLQIQIPNAADVAFQKPDSWSVTIRPEANEPCRLGGQKADGAIAFVEPIEK